MNIEEVLDKYEYKVENLLPILLDIQVGMEHKYITPEVARLVAEKIGIPYSQMSEVISFYAALNKTPKGKYHIEMCNSTVCKVNDNYLIEEYLKKSLSIEIGETTQDCLFSLDYAPCFGACDVSPSIRINKRAYGKLTVDKVKKIIDGLRSEL